MSTVTPRLSAFIPPSLEESLTFNHTQFLDCTMTSRLAYHKGRDRKKFMFLKTERKRQIVPCVLKVPKDHSR